MLISTGSWPTAALSFLGGNGLSAGGNAQGPKRPVAPARARVTRALVHPVHAVVCPACGGDPV